MNVKKMLPMVIGSLILAGCAGAPISAPSGGVTIGERTMTVYRSPDCSCCHAWADIARRAGWTVATVDVTDMAAFKSEQAVPSTAQSCHTVLIGDYFVEGHVPMAALDRLLAERPAIDGIALPGMPDGSPGMGGLQAAPFEVLAITEGRATVFGSY
jgi:hypothetical protein